jgi:hypothetical protein
MSAGDVVSGAPETKRIEPLFARVGADGVIEGYASLFDLPDLGRDVVAPGAFSASLARRGAGGVRMLWQHDAAEPIGQWLDLFEDHRGLKARGRLSRGVARAREIEALLSEGAIDGLSIGFKTVRSRADRRPNHRRLIEIDLWEISIVTFPLLPQARVFARPPSPIRTGLVA